MRRAPKIASIVGGVAVLLVLGLAGVVMIGGNTDHGRALIERLTFRLSGGYVKLSGLGGSFPTALTLRELQLIDREGVWLTADDIAVSWSPLRLLDRRVQVASLEAALVHMERAPVGDGKPSTGKTSIPTIDVGKFLLRRVELGAPLVGTPAVLSAQGSLRLLSLDDALADVVARRVDGGEYTLHLKFDPKRMDGTLVLNEPASGPLEHLLGLPGLGALAATATVSGVRGAELIDVDLAAGELHGQVHGRVDLTHARADLDYALTAPALTPRPEVAWDSIALRGNFHGAFTAPQADGHLTVRKLRIAGGTQVAALAADLTADKGQVALRATVDGLEIPGPTPLLLAQDAVKLDATLRLDQPHRPLQVMATHPLLSLRGRIDTQAVANGQWQASADAKIVDLTPFAAMAGQDVHGTATLSATLTHGPRKDALTADARLAINSATAGWVGLVGPNVAVQLTGGLTDSDVSVDTVRIAGRTLVVSASGTGQRTPAAASDFVTGLKARWRVDVSDLAAMSSELAGNATVAGTLTGSLQAFAADAEATSHLSVRGSPSGVVQATVHARGLPGAPTGTLRARGTLDGAPLVIDAAVDRLGAKALRIVVREAEWKSAHLDGDLTSDSAFSASRGTLKLRIAELSDLDRLLGISIEGSATGVVGFSPAKGHTTAQLSLEGKSLKVGGFGGDLHLQARGVPDALGLELAAELPDLYGNPATLAATAELNLGKQRLKLSRASVGYRGETLRLLHDAELGFGKGLSIDELRLGVRDAVLELQGQLAPTLDLRASLRQVNPALVNVFLPGLLASGSIEAHAQLQGSFANPSGSVTFDAGEIRFADDAATGLPPVDVRARAQLAGSSALLDARLDAGPASLVTATGTVPFDADGALDLKLDGKLDLVLANPFLEARGMRATGELAADATVTGSLSAPQVGGGLTLAHGSLRDYGHGVNLSGITAEVVGSEGALKIKSFTAIAASGSIDVAGTLGILQAGLPVQLHITAKNAQPIASTIVTANLDADMTVSGTLRQRVDVAGSIHINRANIGIPDSLPPDVAVLDVRRRGQAASAGTGKELVIGIDVAINAPQQILVQGRGVDAEMAGDIKLNGTTDALVATGGLDLQRGSFTLAGNKLNITQGRVSFDGTGLQHKIDPTLDFTASTTISENTASVRIYGPADALKFEFNSSTGQQQDEIMSLLLFGKPANQLTALEVAQVGAALASMSGVGGGGLNPLVKLQKSLGLDRLSVGSNTNAATGPENSGGAAIAAGRYVSKRVYVEGKQTTTGTSQVQVDVDLTKHLKLQTRLGNGTAVVQGTTPDNDPGSSIGLIYQFEY